MLPAPPVRERIRIIYRGASPLELPYTLSREPLRRLAPFAWLASLRSLASSVATPCLAVAIAYFNNCEAGKPFTSPPPGKSARGQDRRPRSPSSGRLAEASQPSSASGRYQGSIARRRGSF